MAFQPMKRAQLRGEKILALPVLLLAAALLYMPACSYSQQSPVANSSAPYGAYLGCFDLARLLYMRGVEGKTGKQYTDASIRQCMPDCKSQGFSLGIITVDYKCWCAISAPDVEAQLPEAACSHASGKGAAVFYFHDMAGTQKCRLESIKLDPENVDIHYNGDNVAYDAASQTVTIKMDGTSGTRVMPRNSNMLYGQIEVTAMVSGASGAVSAFYLRDSDEYSAGNAGVFDEIDFEFLNGHPAVPNSVWLNSFKRGLSGGEYLLKPGEYQKRLGLGYNRRTNNTFLQYTICWQPSRVTWAMEGVPILTKKAGQQVKWMDMKGKQLVRNFSSPDREMHASFSIWSDQSRYQFGGQLESDQSPLSSQFTDLKRIVCDQPITAPDAHDRSVRGPAWLYVGPSWDWDNGYTDSADIQQGQLDARSDFVDGAHDAENMLKVPASNLVQDITQTLGKPRVRPAYRPAPPAPGAALSGNYSGFSVTVAPRQHALVIPHSVEPLLPDETSSSSSSGGGGDSSSSNYMSSSSINLWVDSSSSSSSSAASLSVASHNDSRSTVLQDTITTSSSSQSIASTPHTSTGSSSSSGTAPACVTHIVPYGVCGGPGLRCRGRRCNEAPWPGHCCQNGFECTLLDSNNAQKSISSLWTCQPPTSCPASDSTVCEWEVSVNAACGGKGSGCVGCECKDGPWPGFCCATGFTCTRHSEWHWSCQ